MKTTLEDFVVSCLVDGIYNITYVSPEDGEEYSAVIADRLLVERVFYSEDTPKQRDLNSLRHICLKEYQYV